MHNNQISMPLVSIGVPVYNGEKYLAECLESIYQQTYTNWECFIINNKSTDRSPDIAVSFEAKDKRFKVITNSEFVDMTTNFNNTIKPISKETKYFKAVCADDWLFPEYLTRMVGLMEKYPEAGFCSSHKLDNTIVNCFGLDYYKGPLFHGKDVLFDQLMNKYDVTGSETTVLYRVEILKKISTYPVIFSDNSYHFDTELAYQLLNFSDLVFVFQVLSYTRRHEHTYTTQISRRFNTSLNFREDALFRYKSGNLQLEEEYRKVRAKYGWFLLIKKLSGDRKCLEWHHQHLAPERRFKPAEIFMIVLNRLLDKIMSLSGKVFKSGNSLRS
jgi:glycosyltransferase involved in cell wall biosynthesis